ncbi:ankyrin-2-like isoform X3 [Artemia franciscana]|uniref:ankyrin-2-like isoform X3 n=1 Tax=Artemia franciscana TaxID=6661 RepID=UPI0032DA17D5
MPSIADKKDEESQIEAYKDEQDVKVLNGKPEVKTDSNASFLRAARAGNLDKVLEFLKNGTDINTCNANGLNALHLAAKEGHVNVVEELIARGASVDAATKKGNTALHIASLAGQFEVVQLLVQNAASVNVQSQNGFTPLYMAAQENHDSVVRFLLSNAANQSLATEDGFTPLAVALQQGHDRVVAVLLENDARGKVRLPALHIAAKKDDCKAAALLLQNDHNPDVTSKSGFTPLHIAAHYGNENIANLLIQRNADVNYPAKHHITPLHVAAKWGKANLVTLLLDKGANLETKTRDGLTPLHCAARSGHDSVVDYLVQKEAPISSKTKNGLSPLHMAAQGDHVEAARVLLVHRAPVDDVTVDYLTALHVSAHCGHVRVAKLLLDRKADANARALNGFTPLHIACKKNRIKVVELLLKHGASIEATTESGLTPLHVASFMGCMNIVLFLLQNGAGPDIPTVRGETPLHLAARANQSDIVRVLLRNGAQVDARAREQQTPLHIAARLGNVDIVMLLLQHGASVDATTKDLYTALHVAAKEGQDEVASVLLEHGAAVTATTQKGFTPLHLASKYGNLKVAKLLIQKDAPVDAEGKNGVTPLHVASHYDHQNVALLLLDKGASPHATAKNGYTPLHIAAKKNQMDIATTLLEYGAQTNAESKAGFTPLHLAGQEGHSDMVSLLIEHQADPNYRAKNGLTPLHLCAQEDRVNVASILIKNHAEIDPMTKSGYSPLHVACHFGQINMVRFLVDHNCHVGAATNHGYTPLHQAAQQGHAMIAGILLDKKADPQAVTSQGQTPLSIAHKLGYISVVETLKVVTTQDQDIFAVKDDKYRVQAPEMMHETFMSDSEDEGGDEGLVGDQTYRYLTADEMKGLGDESMNEGQEDNVMTTSATQYGADNVDISKVPINVGKKLHWRQFLVSFMVDARGGAMRGCRHSGVRVIIPPRKAAAPTRITCRYVKKDKMTHPPPLMEGESLASRILELGPTNTKFLGPVIIEVPHFAALRGREREVVILRSDNGETWREHTLEATEEAVQEVLNESFDGDELSQLEETNSHRITRILTTDFPMYFAIVSRLRQEVHAIGPEGGVVSSTVVPQVQAVFPQGALTKKIKVGLQAQPIPTEVVAKLLGNRVAVSPIVTVEPRRRKFHKPITLTIPVPQAAARGMINQYSGDAPTLRLLCSITGGTTRAQWEDVTGSTPLAFVNDCVSFTTTVSARFWLMDCRNITEAAKMATDLYKEAIYVPFMAKFVVFAKRHEEQEARLRVFCMTDDKEDKTLETQEHFVEVAKSRDIEVLDNKSQYLEFGGNLVPVTKSGEQLSLIFKAFRENRLAFNVRLRDTTSEPVGRIAFMKDARVGKGEPPQTPVCNLKVTLPENISPETTLSEPDLSLLQKKYGIRQDTGLVYNVNRPDAIHKADLRVTDICNLLGSDWASLARELDVSEADINIITGEYPDAPSQQAMVMMRLWMQQAGYKATGNNLEKALRAINRVDIVNECIRNLELVTDDLERAVAKTQLDQSGFNALKQEIGGSSRTLRRNTSLDVSYDEQDLMKESESIEDVRTEKDDQIFCENLRMKKPEESQESVYEREEQKYVGEEKDIIVDQVQKQISGIILDAANIVKDRMNKSLEATKADFEYLSDDDKENKVKAEERCFSSVNAHSTPLKQAPSSNEIDFNRHASNNDLILSQSWTVEASPEKLEEFEKSLYEIEDEAQFQKEVSWRSKEIEEENDKIIKPSVTPPPSPSLDSKEDDPMPSESTEKDTDQTQPCHNMDSTEVSGQQQGRTKNERKHKRSESIFKTSETISFKSEWENMTPKKMETTEKTVTFSSHIMEVVETDFEDRSNDCEIKISQKSKSDTRNEVIETVEEKIFTTSDLVEDPGFPTTTVGGDQNLKEENCSVETENASSTLEPASESDKNICCVDQLNTKNLPQINTDELLKSSIEICSEKCDDDFEQDIDVNNSASYDNIGFIGIEKIDTETSEIQRCKSPFEVDRENEQFIPESLPLDGEEKIYTPTATVIEVITSPLSDNLAAGESTLIEEITRDEDCKVISELVTIVSSVPGNLQGLQIEEHSSKEEILDKQIYSDMFQIGLKEVSEGVKLEKKRFPDALPSSGYPDRTEIKHSPPSVAEEFPDQSIKSNETEPSPRLNFIVALNPCFEVLGKFPSDESKQAIKVTEPKNQDDIRSIAQSLVDVISEEAQKRVNISRSFRDSPLEQNEERTKVVLCETSIKKALSDIKDNLESAREQMKVSLQQQGQPLPEESPSEYCVRFDRIYDSDLYVKDEPKDNVIRTTEELSSKKDSLVVDLSPNVVTCTEVVTETIYTVQKPKSGQAGCASSSSKLPSREGSKDYEQEYLVSPCRSPVSLDHKNSDHDAACSTTSFIPTEYDTAHSCRSHTSQEYYSAVSSLSSKDSGKSIDSEQASSASFDHFSETTDTVLASSNDTPAHRFDITISEDFHGIKNELNDTPVDEDFSESAIFGNAENLTTVNSMKRSAEMNFNPEQRQFDIDRSFSEDSYNLKDSPVNIPGISMQEMDDIPVLSITGTEDIEDELQDVVFSSNLQAPDIIIRPGTPEPGAFAVSLPLSKGKEETPKDESVASMQEDNSEIKIVFSEVSIKEVESAGQPRIHSHKLYSHPSIPDMKQKSSSKIERRYSFPTEDDFQCLDEGSVSKRNTIQVNENVSLDIEDTKFEESGSNIMPPRAIVAKRIDPETVLGTTYSYTMSFEKEEKDITDLDIPEEDIEKEKQWIARQFDDVLLLHHDLEDIAECAEDGESTTSGERKDLDKLKESLSSTPDFDVLGGRKFFTKGGEFDDVSIFSLQEFERLEREMLLENMRRQSGESGSGSGDSINLKIFNAKGLGDNISVNSLTEFEKLEKQVQDFVRIEDKAKLEEMLLSEIEEGHESMVSESESCETISQAAANPNDGDDTDSEDYEQRMFEIEEIIRQAQTNIQQFDTTEDSESHQEEMQHRERIDSNEKSESFHSENVGDDKSRYQKEIHSYRISIAGELPSTFSEEYGGDAAQRSKINTAKPWTEHGEFLAIDTQEMSRSSSAGTRATGYDSDSLMSGSMTSSNSVALVTSTETIDETKYGMTSSTDTILEGGTQNIFDQRGSSESREMVQSFGSERLTSKGQPESQIPRPKKN